MMCCCIVISRPLWDERLVAQDYRVLPEPPNNWVSGPS